MNRKSFIQSSSILFGASCVPSIFSLAKENNATKPFKKALGFNMIKEDLSIMDKFKLIKDLGFDGVEINSPTELPINELIAASEQTGILIPSTVNKDHWSKPLSSSDKEVRSYIIDSVHKSMKETKLLGGDTVLVVPGFVNNTISYQVAYDNAMNAIQELIPMAEKTGVKIGLENVWNNFILSPVEAKNFLAEINHPLVGWYFDVGNVLRYGWPEHWIEALDTKIVKVHVKEFSKTKMDNEGLRKGFNVELTKGDVNWPAVMQSLKNVDYRGEWMTLELAAGDRNYLAQQSLALDTIINS